ncbi:MAG: hypothetical protein PHQ43_01170 [Dehalococcoidales bacterium]|nr:hypothetical protein [Dehalococcoidales bacterium]
MSGCNEREVKPVRGHIGCPKAGDRYYNRVTKQVEVALEDMDVRVLIIDSEGGE